MPIIAGGVEASLRRLAHYDYWSDKVRRSILLDAKADLLVFGMGERPLLEIVRRLAARRAGPTDLRDLRGVAYRLGASEAAARTERRPIRAAQLRGGVDRQAGVCRDDAARPSRPIPTTPGGWSSATGARRWWSIRRRCRWNRTEMDRVYGLPFTRRPHPSYGDQKIPAFEVVRDSIQIMRGCFGGCTFCSITAHEGRIIQSRSRRVDPGGDPADGRRPGLHGRDQRHRRPDGQHVPDELHAARGAARSAGG